MLGGLSPRVLKRPGMSPRAAAAILELIAAELRARGLTAAPPRRRRRFGFTWNRDTRDA